MNARRSATQGRAGGALIVALLVIAIAGPYFLGAWIAVQLLGADNPSGLRTLVAWVFEVPWLLFVAFMVLRLIRQRRAYQEQLAAYNAPRAVAGPGGSTVYHHGGCTINHRTIESAQKCRKGVAA